MQDSNLKKRTAFIVELLRDLKEVSKQLEIASSGIETVSGSFYEKLYNDNKCEIQAKVDQYNLNVEKISRFNIDTVAKINSWYGFIKDTSQIKKIGFPIKFYHQRRKLAKSVKYAAEKISEISIENRFIKEQLELWEQELAHKALQLIRLGDDFKAYEQLVNKKEGIISELKYLLPTLPGICPVEFDLENIDKFIEELMELNAA